MAEASREKSQGNQPSKAIPALPSGLIPWISTFGSVATPITLAVTGTFYIAGWAARSIEASIFGLDTDEFEHSLQSTIADGYAAVSASILIFLIGISLLWLIAIVYARVKESPSWLSVRVFARIYRTLFWILLLWILLAAGLFTGKAVGAGSAMEIVEDIGRGCRVGCYKFYLRNGQFVVGEPIFGDKTRVAIYSQRGTFTLRQEDILLIQPIGKLLDTAHGLHHFWLDTSGLPK